jgi:pimeloyl-ACP methyl ester carboxylesterase
MMTSKAERTYILIPGGWHGAWAYNTVIDRLNVLKKKSIALTLPGLEKETVHHDHPINLDTHIQFVVDFLNEQNLTDVILCGHSYGGLVITGVADKIPEKIGALVYIDAYVPENGDSCWSLTSDAYRNSFVTGACKDGFTVAVRQGTDTRRRPQPLATFMQGIRLTGRHTQIKNRSFIYLSGWEGTPFTRLYERLQQLNDWQTESINCVHNVMRERPDELTRILCRFEERYV